MIKTTKLGRDGMVRVTFTLPVAEPTGAVSVVGDFNDWNPFAHPLRRRGGWAKGIRSASVTVPPGSTLRFRYLAEGGQWFDDETISMNGGRDAILAVLSALSAGQGLAEQMLGDPGQVDPHRLHRGA